MKTINVTASKSYEVIIGAGLLNDLDQHLLSVLKKTCKIAIISDSNVWPIYGKTAEKTLTDEDVAVVHDKILSELSEKLNANLRSN